MFPNVFCLFASDFTTANTAPPPRTPPTIPSIFLPISSAEIFILSSVFGFSSLTAPAIDFARSAPTLAPAPAPAAPAFPALPAAAFLDASS